MHGDSKNVDVSGYIKREWIKPPKQFKFDFTAKFVGTLTAEGTYNQTQSIYVNGAGWRKDVIKGKITLELTGNKMKVRLEPSERNHYNDKTR